MSNRFQPSEGAFVYLLGLVVLATQPSRFWLGFVLAIAPIAVDTIHKLIDALRPRSPRMARHEQRSGRAAAKRVLHGAPAAIWSSARMGATMCVARGDAAERRLAIG